MRKFYLPKNEIWVNASVEDAFPFLKKEKMCEKPIISLVGGGGKTSTMYALAEAFLKQGKRVLVTTTTHIHCPEDRGEDCGKTTSWEYLSVYAKDIKEVEQVWAAGRIPVIGNLCEPSKLCMPEDDFLRAAIELADAVVIEADGAKCLPCKIPNDREPVILPECNIVVGVMGMDALGCPVKDVCFRYELGNDWLWQQYAKTQDTDEKRIEEHILTTQDMAVILMSPKGTRKSVENREYYVVLNKCDCRERLEGAMEITEKLKGQPVVFSTIELE